MMALSNHSLLHLVTFALRWSSLAFMVYRAIMADTIEINNYNAALSDNSAQINPETNASCLMTYDDFFTKFLRENRPCVFQSDITREWRCRREWNANGAPNFKIISDLFGDCEAPIADCNRKYYNSQFKADMTIAKYLDYWNEYRTKKYANDMQILYLKDWHCVKKYPNLRLYEVPKYFASDWLNEFYIAHPDLDDDYMFVYMGPKGTWTPFHADVFASYSWSANIVGKKRWLLFPPGAENTLRDSHGQLCFDTTDAELKDSAKYPNYSEETLESFEVIQNEGEIIFVPSGWHHQVWNLEDTISVNHNWINGCNVWSTWLSLRNELSAVMKEVDDCRDMDNWDEHCQLMLKASHGMNYPQFYKFLAFIVETRLTALRDKLEEYRSYDRWKIGREHCFFDLERAKKILISMVNDTRQKDIYELVFHENRVHRLTDDVNEILPE